MPDSPLREWFHLGRWVFDIHTAQELLRAAPRPAIALDVAQCAHAHGLDHVQHGGVPLIGLGPDFDPADAMAVDLASPVILATLHSAEAGSALLLIDGWHRLYRASVENVPTLPASPLTASETLTIRQERHPLSGSQPRRAGERP